MHQPTIEYRRSLDLASVALLAVAVACAALFVASGALAWATAPALIPSAVTVVFAWRHLWKTTAREVVAEPNRSTSS